MKEVVEVASMVPVWRRRVWRPPFKEVEVEVPPRVSPPVMVAPPVMVEDAWERKPPAKSEFALVLVASMVPVWRRRAWTPPAKVEVAVEVAMRAPTVKVGELRRNKESTTTS